MWSSILLWALVNSLEAAYCGTSAIPYSFEVLPDGSFSLGCARPSCFGYEPTTGNWASQDSTFEQFAGHPDGYLRPSDPLQRPPFFASNSQMAVCFTSAACLPDQWAAGYNFNSPVFPLICCSYPPLVNSQDLGTASLHRGEITTGGENQPSSFDYIRNIQPIRSLSGGIERYDVAMGRMPCVEPTPLYQQQQIVAPTYYQPTWGYYQDFRCFTRDSMVTLFNGSAKRMDQISIGDWVKSPLDGFFGLMDTPVENWLHRLPEKETEFVVLKTASGKNLKLTENHYLFRTKCNSTETDKPEMIRAADIIIGDCLIEVQYQTDSILTTVVTEITTCIEKGVYAPLTNTGKIVVNGLVASCFSDVKSDILVQTFREKLIHCDSAVGLESLQCSLQDTGVGLLLDMAKLSLPERNW